MPMNTEIRDKWVNALESGLFKQGRFVLHNTKEDSYCCLGVLCRVLELPEAFDAKDRGFFMMEDGIEQDTLLSEAQLQAAGLTIDDHMDLADFNDWEGWKFPQIAKYIRENY